MDFIFDTNSVSQNDIDPDEALNIRVEDLNWREKQSTSLCDRFQIHIFNKEFEQAEQKVIEKEQEDRAAIFEDVLSGKEDDDHENEQIFKIIMETEMETVIKADYKTDVNSHFEFISFIYLFGGIAVAGVVLWAIGYRRKRK